ncbi:unnamed protein product [Penicillium roqueforti FM164]|uniref:Genomic scaffold, ProqFM164S01 n=1 Tax=Penicillium roqueforti (strain FM164) TaxID=1365484 RepID=W6PW58_PENRF|nr:unnamed protein product [Penicillium roqueforti FM164]
MGGVERNGELQAETLFHNDLKDISPSDCPCAFSSGL